MAAVQDSHTAYSTHTSSQLSIGAMDESSRKWWAGAKLTSCHTQNTHLSIGAPIDQRNLSLLQGGGVCNDGGNVNFNSYHINNQEASYVNARLLPFLALLSMHPWMKVLGNGGSARLT